MKIPARYKGLLTLIAMLIVLPLGAYTLALRKSVGSYGEYRKMRSEIAALEAQISPAPAQEESAVPEEELIASGRLLDAISEVVAENSLSVRNYTPYTTRSEGAIEVRTAEVVVTGGFAGIVRLVAFIEEKIPGCRMISLEVTGSREPRTGSVTITASIVVQQITANEKRQA